MTERPSRRVNRRLRPLLLAGAVALGWAVISSGSAQADDTATPIPVVSHADAGLPALLEAPGSSGRSERHTVLPRASASARHVAAHLPHLPGMPSATSAPATRTTSAPASPRETLRAATNQARGDHAPFQVTKDWPLEARKAAEASRLIAAVPTPAPQLAVSTRRDTSALASRAASASLSTLTTSGLSSLAAPALQPVLAPVLAAPLSPVLAPILTPAMGPRPETVLTSVLDPPAPSTATTPSPTPPAQAHVFPAQSRGAGQVEPGGAPQSAPLTAEAGLSSTGADPAPVYAASLRDVSRPGPRTNLAASSPTPPSGPGSPWSPEALPSSLAGSSSSSRSSVDDVPARCEDHLAAPAALASYTGRPVVAAMSPSPSFNPGFSPD